MLGDPIVLVNRTTEPLPFVADGRHYTLDPGENPGYVEGHAYFAMAQNPLMGSEDYYTQEFTSLVGVKGRTPCDPISVETLVAALDELDRFDRAKSGMKPADAIKSRHVVRGRNAVASVALDTALATNGR